MDMCRVSYTDNNASEIRARVYQIHTVLRRAQRGELAANFNVISRNGMELRLQQMIVFP